MREFFSGWRRKAGCVLLAMAAVLFGMWIRSQVVFDTTTFMVWDRQHEVFSAAGRIHGGHSVRGDQPFLFSRIG